MSLYVGIDCSTQSLTIQVLSVEAGAVYDAVTSRSGRIVWEHEINFDRALPQYGTRHGVLVSDDPAIAHAPPQMWADALALGLGALSQSRLDLSNIAAISGSAQQHGTVYLNKDGGFARATSPIWMDTSTSVECAEITDALGGPDAAQALTGSSMYERFAGPQIRKFWKQDPAGYQRTTRIHLVSSFLASRLVAAMPGPQGVLPDAWGDPPIDAADASGMSLMNLVDKGWDARALEATAPGLADRLPPIVPSSTVIGRLAPRWQAQFGLPPAKIVAWTGDNPSSLVGVGLDDERDIAISLGTSDTVFGLMRTPRVSPDGTGHVFASPTGGYMGITVFSNGSLARERVRDMYGLDWAGFSTALRTTPFGNGGARMLPYFVPEITPHVPVAGVRRFNLDERDAPRNVRAIVEAQMAAMRDYTAWMRPPGATIRRVIATGGASTNTEILNVMAATFGVEVQQRDMSNSSCLGAAIRAWRYGRA